jgi:hypothetical protein
MGRYQGGKYYRNSDDAELQWLEDGVGLIFSIAWYSLTLFVTGIYGIVVGLFYLLSGRNSD